jgi:hypothetical protein
VIRKKGRRFSKKLTRGQKDSHGCDESRTRQRDCGAAAATSWRDAPKESRHDLVVVKDTIVVVTSMWIAGDHSSG